MVTLVGRRQIRFDGSTVAAMGDILLNPDVHATVPDTATMSAAGDLKISSDDSGGASFTLAVPLASR